MSKNKQTTNAQGEAIPARHLFCRKCTGKGFLRGVRQEGGVCYRCDGRGFHPNRALATERAELKAVRDARRAVAEFRSQRDENLAKIETTTSPALREVFAERAARFAEALVEWTAKLIEIDPAVPAYRELI